jgi:hypothetical protein
VNHRTKIAQIAAVRASVVAFIAAGCAIFVHVIPD